MCEVLVLLNQLVLRYKEALAELLEQALPLAVQRVHALLPPDWDWSGQWGTAGGPATPGALRGCTAPTAVALQRVLTCCSLLPDTAGCVFARLRAAAAHMVHAVLIHAAFCCTPSS